MKINYNSFIYRKPILGILIVNIMGALSVFGFSLGLGEAFHDYELSLNPTTIKGEVIGTKYSLAIINTAIVEFDYDKSKFRFDYRYLVFTDYLNKGDSVEVVVTKSKPISYGLKFRFHSRLPYILFIIALGIFGFILFSIIGTKRILLYKKGIKSAPFNW